MNPEQFDTIARVYQRGSRRQVLRLVGGTALGATVLSLVGRDEASAKCRSLGATCGKKKGKGKGKKRKCCSGATCQAGTCQCPSGTEPCGNSCCPSGGGTPDPKPCPPDAPLACGAACCKPGQLCLGEAECINGDLEPGDHCNPDEPFACQTGNCQCISDGIITQCTCRQETCFGYGVPCTNTVQCCTGGCEGFTNTCLPIEP
jgi:hypothetical protein